MREQGKQRDEQRERSRRMGSGRKHERKNITLDGEPPHIEWKYMEMHSAFGKTHFR